MKKKLNKLELKEIHFGLPSIKIQLYENREIYHSLCVSVFDKTLTKEECESIYEKDNNVILERKRKLENVIIKFYQSTNIYLWRHKRHYRIFFYKPNSINHLLNHCDIKNQTWQTGRRYDLLLPEHYAVYSEEWDWTNIIWYRDYEKIKPLLQLIEDAGLFILK